MIGELQVLRDSHDQFGNRYIETTRAGRQLLQLFETLLSQRTRYTGTGAETLLSALNDILISRQQITEEEALSHHREKIKAYQKDMQRIQQKGLDHAELLPIPHSNEALFSQAEEVAGHILSSIEDVKTAIERQRQELAAQYFTGNRSAGQSLNAVAEFYEGLFISPEYASYSQAKQLLSHLEGYSARFSIKDINHLLHKIRQNELISEPELNRSQLRGFMRHFAQADHSIQEKVKSQIKLLQQQVQYAISTDIQGLQGTLHSILAQMFAKKEAVTSFLKNHPVAVLLASEFEVGPVIPFSFEIPAATESLALQDETLDLQEQKALFLALLQAEEATLQSILLRLQRQLREKGLVSLGNYPMERGFAEYYVLSEADLFDPQILKMAAGHQDLLINTKYGEFILQNAPIYNFSMKEAHVKS